MARLHLIMMSMLLLLAAAAIGGAYGQGDGAEKSADAPAPSAQLVWLPPADPQAVCTSATFNKFTKHNPSCAWAFYFRRNPDLDCCEGLAEWYGPNASHASRNCWCDADAWSTISSLATLARLDLGVTLDMCAHMGYPVGKNNGDNQGWCYGVPPDPETLAAARIRVSDEEILAQGQWDTTPAYFKKMHQDSLITFAFTSSVFAGVGVLLLVWPLLVDSAISTANLWKDVRA